MQFVESVVEKMCNTFMSKIVVSIEKAIFSKILLELVEKCK
jgi:hypothetical protein